MSNTKKNVLVVARKKKVEALRMATGLTLLDDQVAVAVMGGLDGYEGADEQLEALDFAEVPIAYLDESPQGIEALAVSIRTSDAVYIV